MTYHIVFLFLVASVCADNYVHTFAQEWPGGICRGSNCTSEYLLNYDGRRWNMHGLWPNLNVHTYCQQMETCTHELYNQSLVSAGTLELLNRGWVGLYANTEDFRKHEYEKHGTCLVQSRLDGIEWFFSTVMVLHQQYNLYDALAASGIHPSNTTTVTQVQVVQAVQAYLQNANADVHMSCIKEESTGHFHLGQLRFCLGDDLKPRSCDCKVESTHGFESLVSCPTTSIYYSQLA